MKHMFQQHRRKISKLIFNNFEKKKILRKIFLKFSRPKFEAVSVATTALGKTTQAES